jgi:hypothetical protein
MQILSHRGYWKTESEKNRPIAFERSFILGFGTETDFRDFNGDLVISHDIADKTAISAREFFEIYCKYDKSLPLALNIKADGLQHVMKSLLVEFGIENYFVFDMSVPDAFQYIKHEFKVFTRKSEFETIPSFLEESEGIWFDEFKSHWITNDEIASFLSNGKKVCIVSPDLHKRDYLKAWDDYKNFKGSSQNLMICTDFPEQAKAFFNED